MRVILIYNLNFKAMGNALVLQLVANEYKRRENIELVMTCALVVSLLSKEVQSNNCSRVCIFMTQNFCITLFVLQYSFVRLSDGFFAPNLLTFA